MMKQIIFASMLSFMMIQLSAQTTPKLITQVEGISEYELTNGLRVLLIPDAAQTNVVVNIVYKVGSRHEGYGEKGMAHLIEHMLFKQCGKFTDIKTAIADKGAMANGTTWYDRTNYYEVLSGTDENLRWALDMEADRMVNSKILPEELQKEFSVVRNEFEMGENDPGGILGERIISAMYLWHNYGMSTIGSKEDIERVKAPNLKSFYKKYYQPDNAVLIIAGKFDNKKALGYVQQYFGPIPKPTRVLQPTYTVEPAQDGEKSVVLRRNGDVQYVGMAYHSPAFADADYAVNTALIELLTNNPSGVFYKKLVDAKLATSVLGYTSVLKDPGFTFFRIDVPLDKNIDSAKDALLAAADGVGKMKFSEEELTRAKNTLIKSIENTANNTLGFSIALTEYIGAGDWRLWFLNRDRIEKLTVDDLERVAAKYYKKSNRTYGVFIPDTAPDRTAVAETPDIAALLKGYKGKETVAQTADFENSISNIKQHTVYGTLSNGGRYALLEKPAKGDKINAIIQLRFGDETSLANKREIGSLLAGLLKAGTTTRSKQQISDELDRIKTNISFSDGAGVMKVVLNTDKANLAAALDILRDLLNNPGFEPAEFDKLLAETRAGYESNRQDPQTVAFERLVKLTSNYPKGHPLYAEETGEVLDALNKVTLDDLKKYFSDFYGADHSLSVFVGALDKNTITSFLNNVLGKWNSKSAYTEIKPEYFEVKNKTEIIITPDKANAVLAGGINLQLSEKDADYPAVMMANELLGGGVFLSSRIPKRLREKEGMSYGAGSSLSVSYDDNRGNWSLYAIFNPGVKNALNAALNEEIDNAMGSGFTQDELSKSVGSLLETNKTYLGIDGYLANIMISYLKEGRDLNEFTELENKVKALKLSAVNAAMRKYFDKSKMVLVYAGDFDKK